MENTIYEAIEQSFRNHFLGGSDVEIASPKNKDSSNKIVNAVKTMSSKNYWTKVNTVEAWGFATKIVIIFPGLLFDAQIWWLYLFAIASSLSLIWTSTKKTLPTIILFNVAWVILAVLSIVKHFWWF